MRIPCPVCERAVTGAGVSMCSRLATCVTCHTVFDISEHVIAGERRAGGDASVPRQESRAPVALPHGLQVARTPASEQPGDPYRSAGKVRDDMTVTWSWYHRKHWFVIGFTLLWLGFLAVWYTKAGFSGDWLMLFFPSLHVIAGAVLGYVSLALIKNRTAIIIHGELLDIRSGPIPWPGQKRLPAREIAQLYCREEVSYHHNNRPVMVYGLYARMRSGQDIKLTNRLAEPEQALYLEQQLEDCLGIVDVAMPGELDKRSVASRPAPR